MNIGSMLIAILGLVTAAALAALAADSGSASSTTFDLSWHTISSGGGTSTGSAPGGALHLSGTIGQPDAGSPLVGGPFSLAGGFWPGTIGVPTNPCPPDIAPPGGDGLVNVNDLLAVINGWGACPTPCPPSCTPDITSDCVVNVNDLLAVINAWGPCP